MEFKGAICHTFSPCSGCTCVSSALRRERQE